MGGVIGDIAMNSKGEIFAGAYPVSQSGLFKSTDNGSTWNRIETQFGDLNVYSIYITDQDHIWIGTDNQDRIYISSDNGNTWENKSIGYGNKECWAFGESKEGILFAGDGQYGGVYRSINYGASWEYSDNLRSIVFATDSSNIIYTGTFSGLYLSTDNGITWEQNDFLNDVAISSLIIDDENNIYCGTGYNYGYSGNGVYFSNNAGKTWLHLGLSGIEVLSLAFDSERNLYAGTLNDGLFQTSDMGQNWQQIKEGLYRKQVYRLKINEQDDILVGTENEGVFRKINTEEKFEQVGLPISNINNFAFSGDSLIITSTSSGVQKYNRLSGKWKNIGLHNVLAVNLTINNDLYAATWDDGLFRSTNLGRTWELTNLTSDSLFLLYNVLAINNDTLFVSTFYNLMRSSDGGETWQALSIDTGFEERGLFFKNNIIWVVGFNTTTNIYKSYDFGESFSSVYTGIRTWINNPIAVTDDNLVFISIHGEELSGVLRSTDEGENWEHVLINDELSTTIFAGNDGTLLTGSVAYTFMDTSKIYFSTNYGNTWQSFPQPKTIYGNSIRHIAKDNSDKYYVGFSVDGLYGLDVVTKIEEDNTGMYRFHLSQNYPNPFNPITQISYSIPHSELVQIKIYDMLGKEVLTLLNEYKEAGSYQIEFDGSNLPAGKQGLTSGVYLYRILSGKYSEAKKMLF